MRSEQGLPSLEEEEPTGPTIPAGLHWIWRIFADLSRARDYGDFGHPRAIKTSDFYAYCDIRRIHADLREELYDVIVEMDIHYVARRCEDIDEEREKEAKKKN